MSYLIELSNQGKTSSRYLFSYQNECLIYEDKLGLLDVSFHPADTRIHKVHYYLTKTAEADFCVKDKLGISQNYRSYSELCSEDFFISVFYISEQAELNNKCANIESIESPKKFLLSCPQLNLNLEVMPDSKISLGSSEFDSIVLLNKGIRPRHLEIKIGQNLKETEFKACLGQIVQTNQGDAKKFSIITTESGVMEFTLSENGYSPDTAEI